MASITIIRHRNLTDRIFAVVSTAFDYTGNCVAFFQVYSTTGYMKEDEPATVLEKTERWPTESGAIQAFDYWIDANLSVDGSYIGSIR